MFVFRLTGTMVMTGALLSGSAANSQDRIVTATQIETCESHPPVAQYGPEQMFTGILFSTIDRFSFDACRREAPCDRTMRLEMNDLAGSSEAMHALREAGFDQYGFYRVTFVGRPGRWTKDCLDRSQSFTEIIRPMSVERLPDR